MIFPCDVFAKPQEVAVHIGHLARDGDLVAVEVVDLLLAFAFCGCQVADLCQGFVCTVMPYVRIGGFMRATACLLLGVGSSERQNPCVCIPHTLRRDWKFHVVYCLLGLLYS